MLADVSESNFKQEVLDAEVPVVVDLWAVWCGPCRLLSPIIEDVAKDYATKVKFCKVNVDENEKIAETYNIMSIPTILLFENGEVKAMSVGAVPKESFKKWLDDNL